MSEEIRLIKKQLYGLLAPHAAAEVVDGEGLLNDMYEFIRDNLDTPTPEKEEAND